jgi:serine/threonine-protein kinase
VPPPVTQQMDRTSVIAGTPTFPTPSDDDRRREGRGGRAFGYALLGLAVLAVFVIAALLGREIFTGGGAASVTVPDVTGLTVPQARDALQAEGLTLGEQTEQNDAQVPKGNIIDQSPVDGAQLEEGKAVDVTVSAGVEETTVPALVGLSLDEASQVLREAGLRLGDTTPRPSEEDRGTVTKVSPKEGETVPVDSAVDVSYASGSNRVPDVTGQSEGEARSTLEAAGFQVSSTTEETGDAEPGTVVSQSPGARETSRLGSTVSIVVATAPPAPPETPTTPTTPPTETGLPTVTPGG